MWHYNFLHTNMQKNPKKTTKQKQLQLQQQQQQKKQHEKRNMADIVLQEKHSLQNPPCVCVCVCGGGGGGEWRGGRGR